MLEIGNPKQRIDLVLPELWMSILSDFPERKNARLISSVGGSNFHLLCGAGLYRLFSNFLTIKTEVNVRQNQFNREMNLSHFPKLSHTEKRQEYPRVLILTTLKRIKKVWKENATLKRFCERKKEILNKFLMNII